MSEANEIINIPIFVVNLKKDIKKQQHMQKLCQKFDLDVEFIEAVYGKDLTQKEVDEVYSEKRAREEIGRELSQGEIGCALSHKKIYKKMINKKMDMALILEDDIEFDADLLKILNKVEYFNDDWELVLLGQHTATSRDKDTLSSIWARKSIVNGYKLVHPCEKAYGTYGYMITRNGAKKLLRHLDIIVKPIDLYTGSRTYSNLYTVNPAVIRIHDDLSDNYHSMHDRAKLDHLYGTKIMQDKYFLHKYLSVILKFFKISSKLKNRIKDLLCIIKPLGRYK